MGRGEEKGTYRTPNGGVCCINVQQANPAVSIRRPPTCMETQPKTERQTQGGEAAALKPEIDDGFGVCVCTCGILRLITRTLPCVFMCVGFW